MAMVESTEIKRGDIMLVSLEPTKGKEIKNARPCVVVSPDELNKHLRTFIIAPMTTGSFSYPFRVECRFKGKLGHIVLDQIRTVDRIRLIRPLGRLPNSILEKTLNVLKEMFAL
jgi:mRNA interferase MazF